MSTTTTAPAPLTGNLSTEKVTYRAYVKLAADGTVEKIVAKAQSKDGKNWEALEKDGYVQFNENEFIRYTVKDLEAARLLVPDEKQLMYIFQAGLNYVQNAKSNSMAVEIKEGTDTKDVQAEPVYNGEEIDLRESVNTPTERKSLSPMEKLEKLLAGFPPEVRAALLAQAAHSQAVQQAAMGEVEEQS